jgi:hypothetical protein
VIALRLALRAQMRAQSFSIGGGKKLRRSSLAFAQAAAISAFDFYRDKQPPCTSSWRAVAVVRKPPHGFVEGQFTGAVRRHPALRGVALA